MDASSKEPTDRQVERETNTWWLGANAEDRKSLSVAEVAAAFESTAAALRGRVRRMGVSGPATFYVWHDKMAGQLRCSTGSVLPDELPFGGAYVPSEDLGPVIEEFLSDGSPGVVSLSDLDTARGSSARTGTGPEAGPLRVWVSSIGATSGRVRRGRSG
ncbi:hypothetical protein AB0399_16695 [Streptomyces sp. NPDC088194]|uniref:hypothetical protein n=1 Tax=Streptomyces sp. NPDC088194 TaxID=3154931 RepID=UPI00345100AA